MKVSRKSVKKVPVVTDTTTKLTTREVGDLAYSVTAYARQESTYYVARPAKNVTTFYGPSGTGKTTLLKRLRGIHIAGGCSSIQIRSAVGACFNDTVCIDCLSPKNLKVVLELAEKYPNKEFYVVTI